MDFGDAPAEQAFREEFRAWLAAHHPGEPPPDPDEAFEFRRAWQQRMHADGWAAPGWPAAWGGRDATVAQQVIYQEELVLARAPSIINTIGVWNIGPTILTFGTAEQQRRWLPPMLAAEEIWCQGFSEPGAGSDLAALTTRAERRPPAGPGPGPSRGRAARDDGGEYVVSGQKIWTSYARRADRCFLLCRTDPSGERHRGLSVLAVDMRAPGVETRPIRDITGGSEFDEIFLDGVRVPEADRVGSEGDGWRVAMSTLTHERVGTVTFGIQLRQRLDALLSRPEMWPADSFRARLARQEIAELWLRIETIRLTALRAVTKAIRGQDPWPEVPIGKMLWSFACQELPAAALRAFGLDGVRWPGDPAAPDGGRWARDEVWSRMTTIGAGTTEIQKNILAERALGLPR